MKKTVGDKLESLGYRLPSQVKTVASYVPAKEYQGLIYTSGQLPFAEQKRDTNKNGLLCTGPLSTTSSQVEKEKAQTGLIFCLLNALAAAHALRPLEDVEGIVRLGIFIQSEPNFHEQHLIANPVSRLAEKIFSHPHARTTIGVISLPLNSTVEMEVLFSLKV